MQVITSENNPLIKEVKSLKLKKYREQKELFFIEGVRFVEEALLSEEEIKALIISKSMANDQNVIELVRKAEQRNSSIKLCSVPDNMFKNLSDTQTPQGVIAVVKMKAYNLNDAVGRNNGKNNLFIILDAVQDPGNMGTIIRTADAAGFNAVIAGKGCVDIYNPKVLRSTMGSIFHIPVIETDDLSHAINYLKSKGIKIYASHLNGMKNYYELNLSHDIAFIVGNEANGISDQIAALADCLIKIPMYGRAESLNAAIAAGILMYEVVRQISNN
ncbi:MAG TPA: 23S rRNA (guanosine(2251)-2'-O)-methyltransferase RlmB [Clostridiaceae bacterium]|nr:23S rRNA (guanosine(2251)-2'-O)-methyltransferase RlmB [Clostridiaceae bacterium]